MGLSPSFKISHAGAEFNTSKAALSIDVEHAGDKLLDTEWFSFFRLFLPAGPGYQGFTEMGDASISIAVPDLSNPAAPEFAAGFLRC